MKIKLVTLAMAFLLILSVPIVGVFAKPAAVTKPMAGVFWGTWTTSVLDEPTVDAANIGKGLFTHLGFSNYYGVLTTTWDLTGVGQVSGTLTLKGACGQEISISVVGTQTMDALNTYSDFSGTYTIVGGTGKFLGAAGSGIIEAHLTIAEGYMHGTTLGYMYGTIVIPK